MLEIRLSEAGVVLKLEHSLASIREWEANWKKSFFKLKDGMTTEESEDYIRCMSIEKEDRYIYELLSKEDYKKIEAYMSDDRTATKFYTLRQGVKSKTPLGRKTITSEILYQRMIMLGIPFECQYWHINQLLTLIRVCQNENGSEKSKMSKKESAQYYRKLNEERRKRLGTKG